MFYHFQEEEEAEQDLFVFETLVKYDGWTPHEYSSPAVGRKLSCIYGTDIVNNHVDVADGLYRH